MRIILSDTAYKIRVEGKREPPLGLSSIASTLRLNGHEVFVMSPDLEGWSVSGTPNHLLKGKPDIIGLTILDQNAKKALKIIKGLRRKGFKGYILLGGYWPSFNHREILENFPEVDFCIRGEGEIPTLELLNALEGKTILENVPSLSYRKGTTVIENPIETLNQDLDSLPFAARDYTNHVIRLGGAPAIYTGKGCPANCSFCDIVTFYRLAKGNKLRTRSPEKIIDEIEFLVRCFSQPHITMVDDNFLMPGKRGEEFVDRFVEEIKNRNLHIKFDLMCRADMIIATTFQKLKDVGLNRVFIGAESGHQRGLQTFNKRITVEETYRAIEILHNLGITFTLGLILVDPWTTFDEFTANVAFLNTVKKTI